MRASPAYALPFIVLGTTFPCVFAQTPLHTIIDPLGSPSYLFGSTVCNLGDLDGDGYVEVSVSGPGNSTAFVNIYSSLDGTLLRQHFGAPSSNDHLGFAVARLGDVDADGVSDYAIGSPKHKVAGPPQLNTAGRVTIFSGATGSILQHIDGTFAGQEFGSAIDSAGDVDGDTVPDLVIGSFKTASVYSAAGVLIYSITSGVSDWFGYSVTGMGDLNGDGRAEFAVGAAQKFTGPGYVKVYDGLTGTVLYTLTGPTTNSWFGLCVRRMGDVDGDGKSELAVGAPAYNASQGGEGLVRIHSGATGSLLRGIMGQYNNENFGTSIDAGGDIDGDGQPDLIIGAPNAPNLHISSAGSARGYSGATGVELFAVRGTVNGSNLGQSVALIDDLDGDAKFDFVAGSIREHVNGAATVFSGACYPPQAFCVAKVNSQGCVPSILYTGNPSLYVTDNFHVRATNVLSHKPGLMLYGLIPQAAPFFGGTLCVYQVIRRTPGQNSAGSLTSNCTGSYDFFLSQATLNMETFVIGQTVYAQIWSRDPGFAPPNNIGLTDALRFTICD